MLEVLHFSSTSGTISELSDIASLDGRGEGPSG